MELTAGVMGSILKSLRRKGCIRGHGKLSPIAALTPFAEFGIRCGELVGRSGARLLNPHFFVMHYEVEIIPVDAYTEFSYCLE